MLTFDLETDGLLQDASKIHCLAIHDSETDQILTYNDQGNSEPISRGIQRLEDADAICGHNIIGFDLCIIRKFYPFFSYPDLLIDTLLLSRLYHPNLIQIDKKHSWSTMPLKLYGRHSLEAYGHRLNEFKGNFCSTTDWQNWSEEMEDYMVQDVHVTLKLWKHFQRYLNG